MVKVSDVKLKLWGTPDHIYDHKVIVVYDSEPVYVYENKEVFYRAEDGDLGKFFYYDKPSDGYHRQVFELKMVDGSIKILKGPFSSNCAAINAWFPDKDKLFSCVNGNSVVVNVKVKVLESFGLVFAEHKTYLDKDFVLQYAIDHPEAFHKDRV